MRNSTRRLLTKLGALAAGPVTFIQVGTCDTQYPPPHTRCRLGVCIADEQVVVVDGSTAEENVQPGAE